MQHNNSVNVVIGSWGSYNACNERALGSKWLDLSDYSDWEEIEEELTKQGFKLNGIDEELFIQDIENFPGDTNWDYLLDPINSKQFYARSYVWNKDDDWCSEFGDIVVSTALGGLRRIG